MIRSFVKNGRLMSLAIALLVVSGLGALSTLPRTEDPHLLNRIASVITHLPGASAERVEVLVTEKIEQKLRRLSEINLLTSVSRPGISVIQIKLQDEITDSKVVWSRVRDLLNDVMPQLPATTLTPTLEDDRGYAYTQLIALNWHGIDGNNSQVDITSLGRYANELQNQLKLVPGTDLVSIFGAGKEEILVEIDQAKTSKLQLTTDLISQKIRLSDAKVSAGLLVNSETQMQVELTGALNNVERIKSIPIKQNANGSILTLGDIAQVSKKLAWPASEMAIVEDKEAVVVATRMIHNIRIDKWTAAVQNRLSTFEKTLPSTISLEVLFDQNKYTDQRLGDLIINIAIGFILISSVLLVTLGWRSAAIVATSLPLTVLFTLSVMRFYGLPIHQMSVTGLVVALGIMVDNAIVITDTIQGRRQLGFRRLDSVGYAIKHLWMPLLGSTITTILAFMPIVLMPGPAGEFVGGIALSVIFSLIGSYIISHTIVAGLAGRFLKKGKSTSHAWHQSGIAMPRLGALFEKSLRWSLNYRKSVILLVFVLPFTGFMMAKHLTEQFFPASDRDMFQIELFLPAQNNIEHTRLVSHQISEYLYNIEGIEKARWFIGKNAPSFYYNLMPTKDGLQNYAQGMITAQNFRIANKLIPKIQRELDDLLPNAQILVRKLEQGPPFNAPVELRVYGPNLDTLKAIGDELRQVMNETPEIMHTRATLQPGTPKIWVEADETEAALVGLSLVEIANQLNSTLYGQVNGSIIEATESIPVRVRLANTQRENVSDLASINLVSGQSANQSIPLSAIANLSLKPSRGAIPHRDGQRVNVIEGYIRAGVLASIVLKDIQSRLAEKNYHLPAGYQLEIGGESAERDEAVSKLMASVGVIFTLLITVVVLSFNSFRLSAIIFFSAFQSVGLGLLSIFIFDYPFGFTVIIGLLGLMGLAINAAIVIIAELKSDKQAVKGDSDAIIRGVQSCTRHITSTTITTVGGFLPLILAGGGFWPPFAIAIAGGTVLTTLLSFYFVPAAFSLFSCKSGFETTEEIESIGQ